MNEIRMRNLLALLVGIGIFALPSPPARAQTEGPPPLTLRMAVELALERAPQLAAVRAESEGEQASARLANDAYQSRNNPVALKAYRRVIKLAPGSNEAAQARQQIQFLKSQPSG